MVTDLDDDLFSPADAGPQYGTKNGRYHFPAPPGEQENRRGWMRMTNLVSAFSDQKKLQDWLTHRAMMGLREDDGLLVDEWLAEPLGHLDEAREKALALQYAEKARERAGGGNAARRGTARHLMMSSYFEHGTRNGTRSMLLQLDYVLRILDRADLEIVDTEDAIWHPAAGGTMGRRDARVLCRRTGQIGTLDWKTQQRFWTWQEIAGQLFGYDSATWRWTGPDSSEGAWTRNESGTLLGHPGGLLAGKRVALVMHMPLQGVPELHEVDLEYGRAVLETAARNVELRSIGRSTAVERRPAAVRPWG